MTKELISPKEARRILGVSDNKLRLLVNSGALARHKVRGVQGYKYDKNEVLAMISQE